MKIIDEQGRVMTKQQVVDRYLAAEKPYEVCAHTNMGGYMEFMRLERNILSEVSAKAVCDSYAELWGTSENVKSVCVRLNGAIVYEVKLKTA